MSHTGLKAVWESFLHSKMDQIQVKTHNLFYFGGRETLNIDYQQLQSAFRNPKLTYKSYKSLKLWTWINNLVKLLINPNQQECNTPSVPPPPPAAPTHVGSPLRSSTRPTSNEEKTWGKLWLAKIPLFLRPPSNPHPLTSPKGCFRQTPLTADGRDGDRRRRSSKQREFCVISDLNLESTCLGSHESGPHCMVECVCGAFFWFGGAWWSCNKL